MREALERVFAEATRPAPAEEPTPSLRGLLAKYGPAPSAEELDQNRAEMFWIFRVPILDGSRGRRSTHPTVSAMLLLGQV